MQTYISTVTDPKTVTIVGDADQLGRLRAHVVSQGLVVQDLGVRGKAHNPENAKITAELCRLCKSSDLLSFPPTASLQVPLRSNQTGSRVAEGSVTKDVVEAILNSRCEWYKLLSAIAAELKATNVTQHGIVLFGVGDCLPLMPFNKLGLRVKKTDWSENILDAGLPEPPAAEPPAIFPYPKGSIAVVGASCRLPGASNLEELWELLCRGDDRHEELKPDRFDLRECHRASKSGNFSKGRKYYGNFLPAIDGFDSAFFGVNPREAASTDPQQRLLLELAYEAMECSGYTKSHPRARGDAVGCFIGASFIEYLDNTNAHPPTAYSSTGTIGAFLSGRISHYFGWTGPSEVIDTACSASLVAINRAVRAIQGGECSVALAGGVNLMTGPNNFLNLARAGFLSPTGQCKPFDKDGDGYCRADGAGLVVLKPLGQAEADGDRIMGIIAGTATNQGGMSNGLTVPDSISQARLYRSVLEQGELSPEEITYIEAHGTGTQVGDPLEISSIRSVFGSPERETELCIGSIKGNIGHCETAAGVAGLLKVLCMLEHKSIPRQASHRTWNPKIPALAPDRIALSTSQRPWRGPLRAALVNSYGAAGSNATVLCREAPTPSARRPAGCQRSGPKQPIIISARSVSSLRSYQKSLADYLGKAKSRIGIAEIAYTLSEKRQAHENCIVLEATDTSGLVSTLTGGQDVPFFQRTATPGPVLLVFGGQSRQIVGLAKSFYESFATFKTHLDKCDDILQDLGYPPILPAAFETTDVPDIIALQTGLVAVQYACALTWIDAGLKVDGLLGHSLGELTALAVSGRFSIRDCLKLVAARAAIMKASWGPDKGSMLAVFASRDVVEGLIQDTASSTPAHTLEVACFNSESSQVVSGGCSAIADLEERLLSGNPPVKYARVNTSHGFHSHLVDPILSELGKVSSSLEWKEATIPIEVCSRSPPEPNAPYDPSSHAREPVFFEEAVRRTEARLGPCAWVEAGMDTPIIPMLKRAMVQPGDHTFHAMSTKSVSLPEDAVSSAVCGLWRCSLDVTHWSFLNATHELSPAWLPPYKFDSTTAWLDNVDRAAELQRQLDDTSSSAVMGSDTSSRPAGQPQLVVMIPEERGFTNPKRFRISVEGRRFRSMLTGHTIRGSPLCPASIYLECVSMALNLANVDVHESCLDFEGLDILTALGIGVRSAEISLRSSEERSDRWEYAITSRDSLRPDKTVLHATGIVAVKPSELKLEAMARLVTTRMDALIVDTTGERMRSKRAYDLFSRVAVYGEFLQGISNISISGTEAVAEVVIPSGQPNREESTVVRGCDAVSLDNFIQVAGLLMNTGDAVSQSEVMVCNGIENCIISKGANFADHQSWKVHASYALKSPSQAVGDVVVFDQNNSPAAALTGCRFVKVGIARLEQMLASTSPAPSPGPAKPPSDTVTFRSSTSSGPRTPSDDLDDSVLASSTATTVSETNGDSLRRMLETYTGAQASKIPGDTRLADLGLDSLAATEMAGELQPPDGSRISGQDLLSMTVMEAERLVCGVCEANPPVKPAVAPKRSRDSVTHPRSDSGITEGKSSKLSVRLTELLVETTGLPFSSIKPPMTLEQLGVDSLALTEIVSVLADICPLSRNLNHVSLQSTVESVLLAIAADERDDSGREGRVPANSASNKPPGVRQLTQGQAYSGESAPKLQPRRDEGSCARPASPPGYDTVTAVYKKVDGVHIEADIFMPRFSLASGPMPVALMLHGGAHIALSRKTARPPQIAHLLENNVLPVSLDYRLCPEINVIDGAMTDVRDAFAWVRRTLPSLVAERGIVLDTDRIVVIGWSTGGHLAMSTAWTVEATGQTPPVAILSFYSPVDFLTGDPSPRCGVPSRVRRHMLREQLVQIELAGTPLTKYTVQDGKESQLGPIRPGDPRSELVLSLFEESDDFSLSLLLNGTPGAQLNVGELVSNPPTAERRAAICPTARVRAGAHRAPTFIIHGDTDEVATLDAALNLYKEMQRQGVDSGFLAVKGGYHGYDLRLRPGMSAWDEQVAPGYQFLFDKLKS